jgi:WD40 repeat protein
MGGASRTVEVIADAYQFARHNQFIADLAPLQLYASALVFAPDSSIIKTLSKPCMPSWLLTPPKMEGTWPSDAFRFEGHTSYITAIAFSPDDKLLGTCSLDGTTRIWDTIDASCSLMVSYDGPCSLMVTHDEHKHFPDAIAFSSDSSKFAVAYVKKGSPIKVVVTTRTGTSLRTMQLPRLWSDALCLAVALEDDAVVLIAADKDEVQVWRSVNDSKNLIRHWTPHLPNFKGLFRGHVCISRDASLIFCSVYLGSKNPGTSSISVLDTKPQVVISSHVLENKAFSTISFSGAVPVYRTYDSETRCSTVRSLDFEHQCESTHLFECASSWVKFSLANARDRVAFNRSASYTVHVEAISKNKPVGERMKASYDRQVTVAPRGNLVVDWDIGRLKVLDTNGLVTKETMLDVDVQGGVYTTISPDCQHFAFGHVKGITVLNIESGEISGYDEIEDSDFLTFSDDNGLMATRKRGSHLLSVWDLDSKQMLLEADLPYFDRLEFSADGKDLITEDGRFHLATVTWTTLESTSPSSFGKDVSLIQYHPQQEWVQFDDEDLLWIPDEYRSHSPGSDARGGTVALGQNDGSVLIMEFSDPSVTDPVARVAG